MQVMADWTSLALVVNLAVGIPQTGDFMAKNFKYVDLTTGLDFESQGYETSDFTSTGGVGSENKPLKLDANGVIDSSAIDLSGRQHNDLGGRDNDITVHNSFLDLGGTRPMTGNLNLNSNKLINVGTPTNPNDGVNKAYADAISVGNRMKGNVVAATTANVTLSGEQTIDGIALVTGDRVLVKDQTNATENGVYVVDSGAWTRSEDLDNSPTAEILNGVLVPYVLSGTVNGGKPFFISSVGTGVGGVHTVGVDDIVWDIFSSPTQLQPGAGIDFAANVVNIDLKDTDSGLTLAGDELAVDWATAYTDAKAWKASDLVAGVVPIADAGGYTSETFVEGALQELYNYNKYPSRTYTAGAAINKGDLLYITANNTVVRFPTSSSSRPIGVALANYALNDSVRVLNDDVILEGVLTGATAGTTYYWNGTGFQTTFSGLTGAYVWEAGVAKNATDLDIQIRYVKKNA